MITPNPHGPSEPILRRAVANRTAGFVGVAGGAAGAQHFLPIRLQFNECDLGCRADFILLDQHLVEPPVSTGNCELPSENSVPTLPPSSLQSCPLAAGGSCPPTHYLDVTLGDQDLGSFAFYRAGFHSLRTLVSKRRSIPVSAGNRQACHQMELRLRGKSARQPAGMPIYYVDLTIRSGTTLEKTLANARGTASRWFRSDRPGQSHLTRLRPRRLRSQQR
jgi:hypothetical protein